jgi:hypothetical protein
MNLLVELWELIFFRAPVGRTLRERYPPNKDAFVTHYSSIELTDEWFVKFPRNYETTTTTERWNSLTSGSKGE